MSYAYKIKLPKATSIITETGVWKPTLMEILSSSEMEILMRTALKQYGWVEDEQGELSKEIQGEKCVVPHDCLEIRVALSGEVNATHTVVADSDDSADLRARRLEAGQAELDKQLRQAESQQRRILVQKLVELESTINQELDVALHQAHAQALEIKAAQMGEIRSISHREGESGELELTIHVKVR